MKPVEVETAQLREAARSLTATGEQTDGTLADFQGRVEGFGQPWGDDLIGMAIGTIYQAALQVVMDAVRSNLDTMDGLAQRLGVAAEAYDLTDEDAATKVQSIQEPNVAL